MRRRYALLLAFGLSAAAAAQTPVPTQPTGQPVAPLPYPPSLYQREDLRKSMNLTADQVNSLNTLSAQTQAKYRDDYAKINALAAADRFARTQELNQQYNAAWNKAAADVFDATQRARYQQLNYQYGGFNSFYDPAVQKRLNLTAEQVKDLRSQWDWADQQMRDVNKLGATDLTRGTQAWKDYQTAYQERMTKYLTAEQQKAWRELTGDPYTFQPYFPPNK